NAQLRATVAELSGECHPAIENLAGLDEKILLRGKYFDRGYHRRWEITAAWSQIFGYVSPYLLKHPNDALVKKVLEAALFEQSGYSGSVPTVDDQDFQTVSIQLKALGLVNIAHLESVRGTWGPLVIYRCRRAAHATASNGAYKGASQRLK